MSDETLKHNPDTQAILQAIGELSIKIDRIEKRLDGVEKRLDSHDAQFESIRQGLVANNVRLDRLEGNFHLLRAEFTVLVEEIRHNRTVLV